MAARRAFESFLILALVSGCINADPCTDYTLMWMEYGRRSSDFYSKGTPTSICDALLNDATWYRFEHDAGNRLIEKPVEPWYCGTQGPIWLNGTHPTDTVEVTAEVCAVYSAIDICEWKWTVRIQLCNESGSEYFVYQLTVPPGCPMAYCVDAASRKQCIPPLIWLQDEFKCGEQITTTPVPPTTTSTSSTSPTEPATEEIKSTPVPPITTSTSSTSPTEPATEEIKSTPVPPITTSTSSTSPTEPATGEIKSTPDPPITTSTSSTSPTEPATEEIKSTPDPPITTSTSSTSPTEPATEEIKSTPVPPTTASTSPTEPSSGWGPWGPWSDCSKHCDHGLQMRRRKCDQPPCPGDATERRECATSNCEELPAEKDLGIVLSLHSADASQDTMLKVVENQQNIDTILRSNINSICLQNASLCCGFKIESIPSASIEYVTSSDIYAAKGFPKLKSDEIVYYKIIAVINDTVNEATCNSDAIPARGRQVRSTDSNFVSFELMEMAARNSASDIQEETGLAVKEYWDPAAVPDNSQTDSPCPTATCIVPIVICFVVFPTIAIIVGCITLRMMKISKARSKSADRRKPKITASNMVYPYVNAG